LSDSQIFPEGALFFTATYALLQDLSLSKLPSVPISSVSIKMSLAILKELFYFTVH